MNATTESKTKRQRHQDRITLDAECLARVDSWIEQVTSSAKGVLLSRRDLVNWLVKAHDKTLATSELNELRSRYFNEVRFLRQAIKDLQDAKQRGEGITLDDILSATKRQTSATHPRRRRARRNSTGTDDQGQASIVGAEMVNVLE